MSHHEIAKGQKTPIRVIASRRSRPPVALVSSAPPHRADTSGFTPSHPLLTKRAGVASLISAIIPDALIGSASARETMVAHIGEMSWLGFCAVAVLIIDIVGAAVILSGGL